MPPCWTRVAAFFVLAGCSRPRVIIGFHVSPPPGGIVLPFSTMTSRLSRWLNDPVILLIFAAGLLAFAVQSGELGTADTMHRLQTTHWLWTSQSQVFSNASPELVLYRRDGH